MKEANKKRHEENVAALQKEIDTLSAALREERAENKKREQGLYTGFDQETNAYQSAVDQYDTDLKNATTLKEKEEKILKEQEHSLSQLNEQWKERMEEKRKREELTAIMTKKKEEQEKQMAQLNKAAEWIQAHWRGLMERRDAEKVKRGRKGKKGKGRRK
jgi:hypothetical protein